MSERELDFKKTPDHCLAQTLLSPERLVLSYKARLHFQEAIEMAATTEGSDVMNALVGVARNMAEAGISPIAALQRLTSIRDGISTEDDANGGKKREKEFMELGMADIYGMLGYHNEARALVKPPEQDDVLWTISAFVYAGEASIRRGENPTPVLEEAMNRVARSQAHWDNHFGKTIKYAKIARVFRKAGLDPKVALSRAEETIETAKKNSKRNFFDYRSYEELGAGFAACGLPEDALRMVDQIAETVDKNEGRDWEVSQALQRIAKEHLSRDDYEAAVNAAKRLGWNRFTATMLANKAVGEVRQGANASETVTEALSVINDAKYPEAYEEIYPLLALALEKSGKTDEARALFRTIRVEIDDMDVLYKADIGFELAKAVDEAGYESEELFRQAFGWADQFRIEEPDWEEMYGVSWSMYEHGIRALIEQGNYNLAKEFIDKYPDEGWSKSSLIADLAKEEARAGLTAMEIETLSNMPYLSII